MIDAKRCRDCEALRERVTALQHQINHAYDRLDALERPAPKTRLSGPVVAELDEHQAELRAERLAGIRAALAAAVSGGITAIRVLIDRESEGEAQGE